MSIAQEIAEKINMERLRKSINMTYIAVDIADGYAIESEDMMKKLGKYQFEDKKKLKKLRKIAGEMVRWVDKALGNIEKSDNFASDSDFIKEVIEIALQTKSEDEHIRLLSSMKKCIREKM